MMINNKLVQMIAIMILLTKNLKAHLKMIMRKTQNANGNIERPKGEKIQPTQQNNQQQANNNQQQSSNQQSPNNNDYMTQDEINEWNKNKPTTHDESQMGYGRGDYEAAKEASEK